MLEDTTIPVARRSAIDIAELKEIQHGKGKPMDKKGPSIEGLLQEQIGLLSDMQTLLREMNNRQAASDISRQALPSVPEHSSSAWNPLLKSARERIDAIIDRWRGSLDVLLVFVGLFSAVVTSFLVDSVENLSPDQAARTNELLANLTEIVIQISDTQAARLNITPSVPFIPDASDIRVNAYWSLALIISISAAALAVAGRAFLAVLTKSTGKPHEMLVDIHQRWAEAERILGPALETLPVILTIPVILFLIGLLDTIFSAAMGSPHSSVPVIAAASLSAIAILLVGIALFYTLIHAYLHPQTSPFRTTISRYIFGLSRRIKRRYPRLSRWISLLRPFRWISRHIYSSTRRIRALGRRILSRDRSIIQSTSTRVRLLIHPKKSDLENQVPTNEKSVEVDGVEDGKTTEMGSSYYDQFLPIDDRVYHATLQATHDDDFLDQAAAAFPAICENSSTRHGLYGKVSSGTETLLSNLEIKSLVHLLSPEASYRCNLTASESILNLFRVAMIEKSNLLFCGASQRLELLDALRDAAQRERSRFKGVGVLWRSTFIQSFAVLSHRQPQTGIQPNNQPAFSRVVNMFNSEYVKETEGDIIGQRVSEMAFSVLYDAALQERRSVETTPESTAATFVNYLTNSSWSIAPLTVAKCLSRWSGRSLFADISIDGHAIIPAIVRGIWADSVPSLDDILTLISWGVRCDLGSGSIYTAIWWAIILQNLMVMMEPRKQLAVTLPCSEQNDIIIGHPLLREILAHLDHSIKYKGGVHRLFPNITAITHAFSIVFEMLSSQLNTPLRLVDSLQVDNALLRILGPSPSNSFSQIDVAACLACWDGTNIFTTSTTESYLKSASNESQSQKILVDAMVRWLWKKVPDSDIPDHIDRLTKVPNGIDDDYRYFTVVLMSLIQFEYSRTRRLDLAFSVLKGMRTDPDAYDQNLLSSAAGLINFIATHTNKINGSFSRKQAESLVSFYDWIRALHYLGAYSWRNEDEAEVEKEATLDLLRNFWKDVYPDDHTTDRSIGTNGELLLNPYYFPNGDIPSPLRYLGGWSCIKSVSM